MDKKRSLVSSKSTPNQSKKKNLKPKKGNQPPVRPTSASKTKPQLNGTQNSSQRTSSTPQKRLEKKINRPQSFLDPQKLTSSSNLFVSAVRIAVIVIGISTILGTVIAVASNINSPLVQANQSTTEKLQAASAENQKELEKLLPNVVLGKEITSLKSKLQTLASQYPKLQPAIFLVDLDDHSYVSIQGSGAIAAASTIKIPILVAFFQDVDQGKFRLDQELTMNKEDIGSGSGSMQYEKPGTQFTTLEVATKMITISDNTATNMLIKIMGGAEKLNQRFLEWGLTETVIRNPLPDLEGTNSTTPEDLGNLLINLERGKLVSLKSRDRMFTIMSNLVRNTLLPVGLEADATIAHKTGDIRSVLGDVGIIDMPNGKRYVASVLVKRPDNDPQAKEFIQKMSQVAYQHLKWQPSNLFSEETFTH
ncbi:beta-lactamase [Stanieria cyanosphaera PCC 7437]|uniref:Beta-lactamase n=1 Tax=Stanieria cyanosphaera (strain ATCC 29371 / PCC 7437) TaxID=111780 RepID=K9XQQ8_STAC7|nr:serine hydrolase [Stanieria cyanosphaera]AFZ34858.1 beta-lactamase [Stanieria cyanosphaera PCC 7437]